MGYITPKHLLKTHPTTLQKPPTNTTKYPPNISQTYPRFPEVFIWFSLLIGPETVGPFKGIDRAYKIVLHVFCKQIEPSKISVWRFPGVLEGLGSSGRHVASTLPSTCKS